MIQLKSAADMRKVSKEMKVYKGIVFKKISGEIEKAAMEGKFEALIPIFAQISESELSIIERTLIDAGYKFNFYASSDSASQAYINWHEAE